MGAVADGLVDKPNQDNKCISPGHLVALVINPEMIITVVPQRQQWKMEP